MIRAVIESEQTVPQATGASYQLGEWRVDPSRRELRRDGECRVLEPKSLAVLTALVQADGEVLGWEALIQAAWQGRVVSDDAVHRQVSKLRQALGDDPRQPRYIQTLPKTGFRLLQRAVALQAAGDAAGVSTAEDAGWALRPGQRALAVAAALLMLVLAWGLLQMPDEPAAAPVIRQLTADAGLEMLPSMAPSGRQLAYSRQLAPDQFWQLAVLDIETQLSTVLVADESHALYPAWSPDGERIAFLASDRGACSIRLTGLLPGTVRTLAPCQDAIRGGGLSWSPDGEALVFSQRDSAGRFGLHRLEVASGRQQALWLPPKDSNGDTAPRIAADGRLAFLRNRAIGIEDIWLAESWDAAAPAPRRLTEGNSVISALSWMGDQLLMSRSRDGGLPQLWLLNPDSGALQVLPATAEASHASADAQGQRLVFSLRHRQVDLWLAPLAGGAETPLLGSTRRDWAPAVSPDGQRLAWLSDRSGSAELWLANRDGGEARKLTHFDGAYTQAPVWRPDGAALLLSAPQGFEYGVFEVPVAAPDDAPASIRRLPVDGDASSPVFLADGGWAYQRLRDETSDLVASDGRVLLRDVRRAQRSADGAFWFCRPGRPGLWRQAAGGDAQLLTEALAAGDWKNWWVESDAAYLAVRDEQGEAWLARVDRDGELTRLRPLPGLYARSGLSRLGEAVVYAREIRDAADLYLRE